MPKNVSYLPKGTCSRQIDVAVDDDNRITEVRFVGGCPGNTSGISRLVRGMKTDDVLSRLDGIRCGDKPTSCPDQLCRAIEELQKSRI